MTRYQIKVASQAAFEMGFKFGLSSKPCHEYEERIAYVLARAQGLVDADEAVHIIRPTELLVTHPPTKGSRIITL